MYWSEYKISFHITCVEPETCSTGHVETEGNRVTASSRGSCQVESVGCEGNITVGIVLGDTDAVHVVVEQLRRCTSAVKTRDSAHVCSVVLQAATRSKIVGLRAVKLSQQDFPLLSSNGSKLDGDLDGG